MKNNILKDSVPFIRERLALIEKGLKKKKEGISLRRHFTTFQEICAHCEKLLLRHDIPWAENIQRIINMASSCSNIIATDFNTHSKEELFPIMEKIKDELSVIVGVNKKSKK